MLFVEHEVWLLLSATFTLFALIFDIFLNNIWNNTHESYITKWKYDFILLVIWFLRSLGPHFILRTGAPQILETALLTYMLSFVVEESIDSLCPSARF
jgi:hypothetical protein